MCLNCVIVNIIRIDMDISSLLNIGFANKLINSALSFDNLLLASLSEMMEGNYYRAIEVKTLWDEIWDSFFNFSSGSLLSGQVLYGTLCNIGIAVSILSVMWIFFDLYDKNKDGSIANVHSILSAIIIPAFVVLMLSNNGRILASTTYQMRGLINQFNQAILENTFLYVDLTESMRALQSAMVLDSVISSEIQACDSLSGTEQTTCLLQAKRILDVEMETYKNAINSQQFKNWINSIKTGNVFTLIGSTGNYVTSNNGFQLPILSLIPSWEEIFFSICSTVMVAYQHSLELALIGSSWVAPIVIGATAFPGPVAERAIFAWLISFVSVGMAKIFFNLSAGFAAHVALEAIAIDANFFKLPMYIFICLFAPVISAALAAGGGVALYRAGTSAVANVSAGLGNIISVF